MPLQTFLNLPESRQKEILEASCKEFALHEYKVASIGNIIKELGVAKGSFYRYFKDKKDLYFHLVEYTESLRMTQLEQLITQPGKDFFDILTENFAMKVRFDLEHPIHSGFQYNLIQEKNNEEIGNVQLMIKKRVMDMVIHIIQPFVDAGQFREDISISDIAYLIVQVQWGMFDYLEMKYGVNFRENVKQGKPVFQIPEEAIVEDVSSFARLILSGIQK